MYGLAPHKSLLYVEILCEADICRIRNLALPKGEPRLPVTPSPLTVLRTPDERLFFLPTTVHWTVLISAATPPSRLPTCGGIWCVCFCAISRFQPALRGYGQGIAFCSVGRYNGDRRGVENLKSWQIVLLCLVLVGLMVLFILTFPSIGSVMLGLIFLILFCMLVWQIFLNK